MLSCRRLSLSFVAVLLVCYVFWLGSNTFPSNNDSNEVSKQSARGPVANLKHHGPTLESITASESITAQQTAQSVLHQLSEADIAGVEKFVFFIGYPRSGHSIIGSMMDAHPNMVIAHEYFLFNQWDTAERIKLKNKTYFFNVLYKDSFEDAMNPRGLRNKKDMHKGYTLAMNSTWQGRFTKLRIIGDKSGGQTCIQWNKNAGHMKVYYQELLDTVQIPVHVLHVVRNPYDMIATTVLYHVPTGHPPDTKFPATEDKKYSNPTLLKDTANYILGLADAVDGMIQALHLHLLQLHSKDFVKDPKGTMKRICDFLEVECTDDYLQECYDKTNKVASRSRNVVVWTTEVREMVESAIKKHTFFHEYSFYSE